MKQAAPGHRSAVIAMLGIACAMVVALPRASEAAVRTVMVPGTTSWLAVDGGAAFVLRRRERSEVVRVDLASGRSTVAFRTDAWPDDTAYAAGGTLAFGVLVPRTAADEPDRYQAITIPTAAGGLPTVLREIKEVNGSTCRSLILDDVAPSGEVVLSTFAAPCRNLRRGREEVLLLGASGDRSLLSMPTTIDVPRGNLETPTQVAGPWMTRDDPDLRASVALTDLSTGTTRRYLPTWRNGWIVSAYLQPDGRFIIWESKATGRSAEVVRVRVVGPSDSPRGGRILGTMRRNYRTDATVGDVDAAICGGRVVVLASKAGHTSVLVDGETIARVRTSAEPRFDCDATRLVLEAAGAPTRLAVIDLPPQ